jgi:hypothetical protein
MSKAFAAKPIVADRPSGAEIRDLVAPGLRGVAVQAPQDSRWQEEPTKPVAKGKAAKPKPVPTVQCNFRVSEDFARLIAREAEAKGGMRKWFAHLARQAGYEVPEIDLNPPSTRREW